MNTRVFYLFVDESLVPFTKSPRKGYTSIQLSNGTFFNTRSRLAGSQLVQYSYAAESERFINEALQVEIKNLQQFWYTNIPRYFNRRSFGRYFPNQMLRSTHSFRKEFTNRPQYRGRGRTGQLRRALIPKNTTLYGTQLYVRPCYAATGHNVDYVNILLKGALPRWGHPYVPSLDRRIKRDKGLWRGITNRYWAEWQVVFERKLNECNIRLNAKIEKYMLENKILQRQDIKRVSAASSKQKNITNIQEQTTTRKSRTTVYKSGYNTTRSNEYWSAGPYSKPYGKFT